ncbi:MAG: hypothetical protein RR087_05590 [Oscillospiraceae bacterium]
MFLIFLGITGVFLLLTWPGMWRWDEFHVLESAKYIQFNAYQNYITSMFYIFSLMLFPFPASVVMMQVILGSAIAAWIVATAWTQCNLSKIWVAVLSIPFLLPAAIGSLLYPLRLSLFAYFEVFLYFYIYFRVLKIKKLGFASGMVICSVTVLLSAWRGETIFYALFIPLLVCALLWKTNSKRMLTFFAAITLALSLGASAYQSQIEIQAFGNQYKIISMLNFVNTISKNNGFTEQETDNIEKVLSLKVLDEEGPGAIWNPSLGLVKEYDNDDFADLQNQYIKLVLKYPMQFAKQQFAIFLNANGMGGKLSSPFVEKSYNLYSDEFLSGYKGDTIHRTFFCERLTQPININVRSATIRFLQCVKLSSDENNLFFPIMYNSMPWIIWLMILLVMSIVKKDLFWCGVSFTVLCKTALVVVAAPGNSFMYYFPTFLVGCTTFLFILAKVLNERKSKNKI